jgi:ribosomal protein L33
MQLTSAFLGSRLSLKVAPAPKVNTEAPRQVTTMAKKKGVRCIITLECTEARAEGATPSRYVTQKVGRPACQLVSTGAFFKCEAEAFRSFRPCLFPEKTEDGK